MAKGWKMAKAKMMAKAKEMAKAKQMAKAKKMTNGNKLVDGATMPDGDKPAGADNLPDGADNLPNGADKPTDADKPNDVGGAIDSDDMPGGDKMSEGTDKPDSADKPVDGDAIADKSDGNKPDGGDESTNGDTMPEGADEPAGSDKPTDGNNVTGDADKVADDGDDTDGKRPSTAPLTTFHLFPLLPTELRIAIWELCLPIRIIPMTVIVLGHRRHFPNPSPDRDPYELERHTLGRPPHLLKVCSESRRVVFSHRRHVQDPSDTEYDWLGQYSWFDPRTDFLFVDCDMFGVYRHIWEKVCRAMVCPAGKSDTKELVGVSLAKECSQYPVPSKLRDQVENSKGTVNSRGEFQPAHFTGITQKEWPIIMEEIWMSMTDEEAAQSGLFGVFCEPFRSFVDLRGGPMLKRLLDFKGWGPTGSDFNVIVERAKDRWAERKGEFRSRVPLLGGPKVGEESTDEDAEGYGESVILYPVVKVVWMNARRRRARPSTR